MEVFVLHILKLNIIAAVVILLVRVLAILFKGRVSARWKYFIWLLLAVTLCVPVRLPANLALVDVKVQNNSQRDVQEPKTEDHTVRSGKGQKITETVSSSNSNRKSMTEIPEQKRTVMWEPDKWMEIVTVIFVTVWLSVAVLKMAGELLAYCLSMKKLERMSLPSGEYSDVQRGMSEKTDTQNTRTQAECRPYHTASCRTFSYKVVSSGSRIFRRRKKTGLLS